MKNKISIILLCLSLLQTQAFTQATLQIDSCFALAKKNYPLVKQFALIEKTKDYSLDNLSKGYLPQLSLGGQATYQSEVTKIPIDIPNLNIQSLSKDQYRLFAELNQPITDLFLVKDQKELVAANAQIQDQKIEVDLYQLRERITALYFGVLLVDEQINQVKLLKKDLQIGIDKTDVAIKNGVALKSAADNLKAESLKVDQKLLELKANRQAFTDMLSLYINQSINENDLFVKPETLAVSSDIKRPELDLFELQHQQLSLQSSFVKNKSLPRFNVFFQGGLGRPALNMLNNDFKGYYIGGLRLYWNLTGFYTYNKEKKIIGLNQKSIDVQKEVFLFNIELALSRQNTEIGKLESLMVNDQEIVKLLENVKNATKTQLEYGTATSNDYLTAVNAEDKARQNLLLHEIQLLLAAYNHQNISGN